MAQEMAAQVAMGKDPAQERRREKAVRQAEDSQTFKTLAKYYLERHAKPRKSASSVQEDERIIDTDLNPA